jgi:hypothetical protein
MSLLFNNKNINKVTFNGKEVTKINFNGVTVWNSINYYWLTITAPKYDIKFNLSSIPYEYKLDDTSSNSYNIWKFKIPEGETFSIPMQVDL